MRRVVLLVLLVTVATAALAEDSVRALRDVRGRVEEIAVEPRADGERWTVVVVRIDDGEVARLGLASDEVLDAEEFRVAVGDSVRARFFADGDPHEVQRLRNETTGRVLRLRCLHGDPLRSDPAARGPRHRRGK